MREKMLQFMAGRNGNDALNRFLMIVELLLIFIAAILRGSVGRFMMIFAMLMLGFTYYRMFSRDLMRRADENSRYLQQKWRVQSSLRVLKDRWVQRKEYKFFTCPSCKATMRVPRGRGKIKIVCRKCGNSFSGKS